MRVGILGPIQVITDDGDRPTLSRQLRRILGLLIVADGSPVSSDRLAEYVARGRSKGSTVRTAVSRLRKVVGDRIEHRDGGYCMSIDDVDLDASEFHQLCHSARSAGPAGRIETLTSALALWRGQPLGELAEEEWAVPSASRLTATRASATEDLADAYITSGRPDEAVELLTAHLPLHPFRERPVALMMRAHADAGRTVEGLRIYRSYRATLRDETGLEPTSELRELEVQLLGSESDEQAAAPERAPAAAMAPAGNLPSGLTSFVARKRELDQLVTLINDRRLVTLIGPAGIGKTRLAIEAAHSAPVDRIEARWLHELASASEPADVGPIVAAALPLPPADGDVIDHVIDYIGDGRVLLIVDNCEHVINEAGELIGRLLTACNNLRILATSREPLLVDGEWLFPVSPLDADDAQQLFTERAEAAAGPTAEPGGAQREAVAELCRRLDGIPLAIELAASRARAFTPVELVAMLDERFRLLVGRPRSGLDRHRTMRATLDWSYDLCSDIEQVVFDRISVFPGAFDLDGARAIAAGHDVVDLDVIDALPRLVDRSMVERRTAHDGTSRYHLLETMRAYGIERLNERKELAPTRDRHASYIAELIVHLSRAALGANEQLRIRQISELWLDQRAAFDWSLTTQQWEIAVTVVPVHIFNVAPETQDMVHRLHDAMAAAGVEGTLYDEIKMRDDRWARDASIDERQEMGWEQLRSSDDRPAYPVGPNIAAGIIPENDDEVAELMRAIPRFDDAPPSERVPALWSIFRAILMSGHPVDDEEFGRFCAYVEDLNSEVATRFVTELRGHVARVAEDWDLAANLLDEAIPDLYQPQEGEDPWFLVVTRWTAIECRLRGGSQVPVVEAIENWALARNSEHHVALHRGVDVTAQVLAVSGHIELAQRFASWIRDHDPGGIFDLFRPGLAHFALDDPPPRTQPDELDGLLSELAQLDEHDSS